MGFLRSLLADATGTAVVLRLAAGETADVNLKLTPQAAISGRVVDSDGDPGFTLELGLYRSVFKQGKRRLESAGAGEIDDRGQFRVGRLPPGTYYVKAEPNVGWERFNRSASEGHLQPTWYPNSFDTEGSTPIILSPGQELSGIEIRLRKSATYRIRGTVSGLESVPKPASSCRPAEECGHHRRQGLEDNVFSGYCKSGGFFRDSGRRVRGVRR